MVIKGLCKIYVPVAISVPPQIPEYQFQTAPALRLPPDKIKVVCVPGHIEDNVTETKPAGCEFVYTVTEILIQDVVLHVPSALTKYIVLIDGNNVGVVPDIME